MRGTPCDLKHIIPSSGIIPAHAGNTTCSTHSSARYRDHPRACGEHEGRTRDELAEMGSSPRMRGTPGWRLARHGGYGIIPAHAGNTHVVSNARCNVRDHPRACGEHLGHKLLPGNSGGSSPRMRGTRWLFLMLPPFLGIIPAHAGNTGTPSPTSSTCGDHPRACGEHYPLPPLPFMSLGSSPRMRGTLPNCLRSEVQHGIIPAHAGNTVYITDPDMLNGDHPRACGEHRQRLGGPLGTEGSSPRMRGTRRPYLHAVVKSGIIPAHAGNTTCLRPSPE